MKERRKSSAWSSRVRFSGASSGAAHRDWYRAIAEHYDSFSRRDWNANAREFFDRLFRRNGPVADVLDVACGTFRMDLDLIRRGYRVVGRDLSPDMVRVGRRTLQRARVHADVAVGDMRTLHLGRTFDAVLCVGTAFNYLLEPADVRRALKVFRSHVRPGGVLILDLTNFDGWIESPMNTRLEMDRRGFDGTRVAIFGFNDQSPGKTVHLARFLTVLQRGRDIEVRFDEAPLKVWTKESIARSLRTYGFRPVEWWGDLAPGAKYRRRKSPRLVAVATRA